MPPAISIECVTEEGKALKARFAAGPVSIGREPENRFQVDSVSISRRHGLIFEAGNNWIYSDQGSTNGSWVNGVRIQAEQLRLLRDGDALQLAACRAMVSIDAAQQPDQFSRTSVLIFLDDKFQSEFPLHEGSSFIVGGPDGHVYIDRSLDSAKQLEIAFINGAPELHCEPGGVPVAVNGAGAAGTAALADGDVVEAGPYRLIVSFPQAASRQPREMGFPGAKEAEYVPPEAPPEPEPVRRKAGTSIYATDDWEPERRRASGSGRKFIFGSEGGDDGEVGANRTMTMPTFEGPARASDMNVSRRVASESLADGAGTGTFGKTVSALLLLFIVLVLALGAFVLLQLLS